MKKIVRITENELENIIKEVINEGLFNRFRKTQNTQNKCNTTPNAQKKEPKLGNADYDSNDYRSSDQQRQIDAWQAALTKRKQPQNV